MAGTEQLTAHIERGWEKLRRGDILGAEQSAQQALLLSPRTPEVLFLMGSCFSAQHKSLEAMAYYQEAMAEDETYVDPILAAADLWLQAFHNTEECLQLCERVIHGVDDEEILADALLLKAEALFSLGELEKAEGVLALVPQALEEAALLLRFAQQLLEVGQAEQAEAIYLRCLSKDSSCADAYYALGCLYLEQGRDEESRSMMLATYRLDAKQAARLGGELEVESALAEIKKGFSAKVKKLLKGAAWYLVPRIGAELVVDGFDPRALCFFSGTPADPFQKVAPKLESIFLYTETLQLAHIHTELRRGLRQAIIAELAHFFALGDAELRAYGLSLGESR